VAQTHRVGVGLHLGSAEGEQRPDHGPAPRRDPAEAAETGPPDGAEEHCLGLVVLVVCGGDDVRAHRLGDLM